MTKRRGFISLVTVLLMVVAVPAFAATPQEEAASPVNHWFSNTTAWIAITAGFAMAIASSMCGTAQGKAVIAACEGIARNPSGGALIRGSLIIGLVLIESLAIYTLLVALLLIFMLNPG